MPLHPFPSAEHLSLRLTMWLGVKESIGCSTRAKEAPSIPATDDLLDPSLSSRAQHGRRERRRTTPARSLGEGIVSPSHTKQVPRDDSTPSKERETTCRLNHVEPTSDFPSTEPQPMSLSIPPASLRNAWDPSHPNDYDGKTTRPSDNDDGIRAFEGM
ncbi:hypothetical protein ARMGADRAFT_1090135 [Armillaria gallica]|uniref:Uncharacterized protein n=1 Tax=Armillaria gallica TaxID=47427 RepID=A0A2H3D0Y6_ARMGA|nr:hypothetical protein ARMGADRAFT_1090135 [Armillaria gallica]